MALLQISVSGCRKLEQGVCRVRKKIGMVALERARHGMLPKMEVDTRFFFLNSMWGGIDRLESSGSDVSCYDI